MIDLLHPEQAALIAGVPAVQLRRWAFFGLGPKNSGTKWKPLFDETDLRIWREKMDRERIKGGKIAKKIPSSLKGESGQILIK